LKPLGFERTSFWAGEHDAGIVSWSIGHLHRRHRPQLKLCGVHILQDRLPGEKAARKRGRRAVQEQAHRHSHSVCGRRRWSSGERMWWTTRTWGSGSQRNAASFTSERSSARAAVRAKATPAQKAARKVQDGSAELCAHAMRQARKTKAGDQQPLGQCGLGRSVDHSRNGGRISRNQQLLDLILTRGVWMNPTLLLLQPTEEHREHQQQVQRRSSRQRRSETSSRTQRRSSSFRWRTGRRKRGAAGGGAATVVRTDSNISF